jgi:multiple sugar transport system substrate-binding protein
MSQQHARSPHGSPPGPAARRRHVLAAGAGAPAALLAACGQGQDTTPPAGGPAKAPVTVEILTSFDNIPTRQPHRRYIETAGAQLTQRHPHISVNHTTYGSAGAALLVTRITSGDVPDVANLSPTRPYENEAAWLNVADRIKREKFDMGIYVPIVDGIQYKGGYYGLPMQEVPQVMFLNVTMFKKRGVPLPPPAWTWDDYLAIAQKLTADGDFGIDHTQEWEVTWIGFLRTAGGDYVNKERTRTTLDTPQAQEAFQYLVDLHQKHRVAIPVGDTRYGTGDQPFLAGKVGMRPRHSGFVPMVTETVKDWEWDVTSRPLHPRTRQRVDVHNQTGWGVLAGSKFRDEAWELVKQLGGEWGGDYLGKSKIYTPTTRRAIGDKNGYASPPPANMAVTLKVLEKATDLSFHKNWNSWQVAVRDAILPAFQGTQSAGDALREASRIGDAAMLR